MEEMLIITFIGSVLVMYLLVPSKVHTSQAILTSYIPCTVGEKRDGDIAPWKHPPIAIGKGEENIYE